MPGSGSGRIERRYGWKYMERWQRKEFHRENEGRVRNGLNPLPKPANIELSEGTL